MIRWIVESSIRLRYLIIIIAAALMGIGITQLRAMPVDVYPEFDPPLVEIQTEALGLSAAEVEALLTVPMEADLLNGVAWLEQIYSESVPSLSSILLVFEPGTDPIRARQMVQERLTQAFMLPNVSKPPVMLQPLSSTNRAMMVGLSSEELSLIDMSVLSRWTIKPRLMGVPGVANVAVWGHREQQLQVQVDPERLQANGVTLDQIVATTGEALWVSPLSYLESSSPGTAGFIDTPNQRLNIRHLLPISTPEDLAQVSVVGSEGLLLGDVANVVQDHQPLIGDAVLRNGPGLLLVIEKFPGANTLEVTKGVEEALEAMKPGLTGIDIDTTIFRPANYIEQATNNLSSLALIGLVLMAVVLFLFHWDWRSGLISLVAIPLSLVAAGFVLYLREATFNMMILAGLVIALGIIIDDAIVDVENIKRRVRQHRQAGSDRPAASIIVSAMAETRTPLAYVTLILVLVILPVFFLGGLSGAFFLPLAVSYLLAMGASLLVALTVTPVLSVILFGNGSHATATAASEKRRESPVVAGLRRLHGGVLARMVQAPSLALIVAAVIAVAGLLLLPFLDLSLLPSLKQTDLLVQWDGPPGTSQPEMSRIAAQVSRELQAIPGVRNVGSQVGRAETGDAVIDINSGELWVNLDPAADYDATVAAIREVIAGYPGVFRAVENYQPERLGQALTRPDHDVVVRVYGHELDVLRTKAEEVQQALAQTGGVVDARADLPAEEAQVEIEVDLAAAEQYGIKPGDVRRSAATLLSGLHVGDLFEDQKVFEVVVWGVPDIRRSLTNIRELLIDLPGGGQVRLGDVADVRIVPTPIIIRRDAVSRFVDVSADVTGRSLASVMAEIDRRLEGIEFPLEYHAEVLGVSADQQLAQQRIIGTAVAAAVGIFLLLQALFGSWRLAALAFLTLPVALAGGVVAAFLGGGVLSLGSLFGFLTVLGLMARQGILLFSHYQHLERHEGERFGPDLVRRGAGDRFAPILMTAFATTAAFLPLIVAGRQAGTEIIQPMAVVILGGLVTSTVLNLFILPALYLRFGSSSALEQPPVTGELVEEGALA
jgi:CzcA family heavy metal efflux pump